MLPVAQVSPLQHTLPAIPALRRPSKYRLPCAYITSALLLYYPARTLAESCASRGQDCPKIDAAFTYGDSMVCSKKLSSIADSGHDFHSSRRGWIALFFQRSNDSQTIQLRLNRGKLQQALGRTLR